MWSPWLHHRGYRFTITRLDETIRRRSRTSQPWLCLQQWWMLELTDHALVIARQVRLRGKRGNMGNSFGQSAFKTHWKVCSSKEIHIIVNVANGSSLVMKQHYGNISSIRDLLLITERFLIFYMKRVTIRLRLYGEWCCSFWYLQATCETKLKPSTIITFQMNLKGEHFSV